MPIITAIAAIAGAGTGAIEGGIQTADVNSATNANLAAQQQQLGQNAQTFQQRQALYNQLYPFFSQYLQQGSPFLAQQQTASAQQNAQQYGNAAGQIRQTMGQSGFGYGPSGATAAALGGVANQSAATGASNYLQNLLTNEQLKFQAAQGLNQAGNLVQPIGYQQVNPTTIGVNNPLASSLSALGPALKGISGVTGNGTGNTSNLPITGYPGSETPIYTGIPTTQGTSVDNLG